MRQEIQVYMFAAAAGIFLNWFLVFEVDWAAGVTLVFAIMAVKS